MKWRKCGMIFNAAQHKLPNRCFGFAQAPQAVVFNEFVRIYFSTRERDGENTFLSHVAFVDFQKDLRTIRGVSETAVIALGELGCFDEHGIFPMNVLKEGHRIHAYTTGWNRKVSVPADSAIGYACSDDGGLTFQKLGTGPILAASLEEPFLVCDAFVQIFENCFHMWYVFGQRWFMDCAENVPQRVYKIGHAISDDGIHWQREGHPLIPDRIEENECQALPSVIRFKEQYLMFFCYRPASGFRTEKDKGYRIGCAFSADLKRWTRDDNYIKMEVAEGGWDANMMCYPFGFECDGHIYLLYNGNEFGRHGFGIAQLEQ